ncbi:Asp-tRNA(Asn)/Glu-tRNA(Gln) amidotransferase subunit GatC [Candidatus Daviesbacteria bacterium]|nr:Asp-tRNA(Asn)/Glu-tRNA(Gln) amidotransferase subunit GatC [Candidatus Daviesbacteria bacterium]
MALTKDQVKHVAKLANLPLSSKEEEKFSKQLASIVDYIDQLQKLDTSGVEPTYNTSPNKNITREDIPNKSLTQEEALQNAPRKNDGFFITKGVFNEE